MLKIAHYDVHHFSPAIARALRRAEHSRAVTRKAKMQTLFAMRDLEQAAEEWNNPDRVDPIVCDWFYREDIEDDGLMDEIDYWDYDDDYDSPSDFEDMDYLDILFDSVFFPPCYEEADCKTQSFEFVKAYAERNPTPDWWDKEVEYQMMVDQVDREWYDLMNDLEDEWDAFEEEYVQELLSKPNYLPTLEEWRWRKAA